MRFRFLHGVALAVAFGGMSAGSAQAAPLAQPTAALQALEDTGLELVGHRPGHRGYRAHRGYRNYGYRRGYDSYAYSPRPIYRPFGWSRSITGRWHYHGQY